METDHDMKGIEDHKKRKELHSFCNVSPLKTSKSHESLFGSLIFEPHQDRCFKLNQSIKLIEKKPHLKVKKYKGKRKQKGKNSSMPKYISTKGVPNWSSIYQHQLVVNKNASSRHILNNICGGRSLRQSFASPFPRSSLIRPKSFKRKLIPHKSPAISTSFVKTQQNPSNSSLSHLKNVGISGEKPFLQLRDLRVVLEKLKIDPNNDVASNSATPSNTSNSSLSPHKNSDLSGEKPLLQLRDLRVVLEKLKIDPNNDVASNSATSSNTSNSSHSPLKNSDLSGEKPHLQLRELRVVLEKLKIDPNNAVASNSAIPNTSNSSLSPLKNSDLSGEKPLLQLRDLRVVLEKLKIDPNNDVASNSATPSNTSNSSHSPLKNSDLSGEKSPLQLRELRVVLEKLKIDPNNHVASNSTTPISFDFFKNKHNFSSLNNIPYASTPAKSLKKLHGGYINNVDLSPILKYEHKRTTKQAFTFEDSVSSQVSASIASRRSVNPAKQGMSKKLHLPFKSFSNIERSIYLQSHSSIKKVAEYDTEHFSILPQLLELCNQNKVLEFSETYDLRKTGFKKIGEGSYGEVFCLTQQKKSFIIKVIPISDQFSDSLQSMASVYSEIKVSLCLNKLRSNEIYQTNNFNLLKGSHVVKGCYPEKLLKAWDKFSREKTALNVRPDLFDEEQMFVIIELEYGGQDLSSFVLRNACEAEIVFKQLAISLAIAEEVNLFEHRDLHLGNILVSRTKSKSVSYTFRGERFSIASGGLMVNIIDFTLSRILESGVIYYNDLADDKSLFEQTGDIQFNVYKATKLQLENKWHECLLFSNVLWLTFLCQKFQEHSYSRPSSTKHAKSMNNIKMLITQMTQCKSALDCLEACKILRVPDKIEGPVSMQNSGTVFIDRKSLQKGKTLCLFD
nr:uncharacterized protein LOC107439342 isoform X2 [Parasteatoda tepidariorum]